MSTQMARDSVPRSQRRVTGPISSALAFMWDSGFVIGGCIAITCPINHFLSCVYYKFCCTC